MFPAESETGDLVAGVILAVLDEPASAFTLLRAAARLRDLCGAAHLQALALRTPPATTIMPTEEILTERQETAIRAQETARSHAIGKAVGKWSQESGQVVGFEDIEAVAAEVIAPQGVAAEYLVIGQSPPHGYGSAWQTIQAALFTSNRPVLIVPPECGAAFGRRIALAWRDDRRTIRALLAAIPCFTHLEQLFILAGQRQAQPRPEIPPILTEHALHSELRVLPIGPRLFGETLLETAHACEADMLVMGAFVRDPLSRLILGGVTGYLLANSDLPLLMRH